MIHKLLQGTALTALLVLIVGGVASAQTGAVEAESFTHPKGTTVVKSASYSGGKALKFTDGRVVATKQVTITGEASNVSVRAVAGRGGGSLTIRIDGVQAGTRQIAPETLADYLYTDIALQPGTYTIGLQGGRGVIADVVSFPAVPEPVLDAHNPEQWQDQWTSISMGSNSQVGYSPPTWNTQKFVAENTGALDLAKLVVMYGFTADQEADLPVRFYHIPASGTPELLAESTVHSNNQHDFDLGYPLTAEPVEFASPPHVQAGETYALAWRDGAARCVNPTVPTNEFTGMTLDDAGNFVEWRTDADGQCGSGIFAVYVIPD